MPKTDTSTHARTHTHTHTHKRTHTQPTSGWEGRPRELEAEAESSGGLNGSCDEMHLHRPTALITNYGQSTCKTTTYEETSLKILNLNRFWLCIHIYDGAWLCSHSGTMPGYVHNRASLPPPLPRQGMCTTVPQFCHGLHRCKYGTSFVVFCDADADGSNLSEILSQVFLSLCGSLARPPLHMR